jgi:hypothetical protein
MKGGRIGKDQLASIAVKVETQKQLLVDYLLDMFRHDIGTGREGCGCMSTHHTLRMTRLSVDASPSNSVPMWLMWHLDTKGVSMTFSVTRG